MQCKVVNCDFPPSKVIIFDWVLLVLFYSV